MRFSIRSFRWLLPVLLILSTATPMAAQISFPRPSSLSPASPTNIAELIKRAKSGDAKAQFNLGNAYHNGEGVTEDDVEAMRWYRKAAERGSKDAITMAMRLNGVGLRDPKPLSNCQDGASTNFSEQLSKQVPWFYPFCTVPSIEDHTNCPNGFFYLDCGMSECPYACVTNLAQCPRGYALVSLSANEPHVKQLSYKCHISGTSIAPDKLALEPALIKEEKEACSDQTNTEFCRSDLLKAIKYRRVRLSPNGAMGVIVEIDATSLCGSGGCRLLILKQTGKEYRKVWEGQGGMGEVSLEKTTTNGVYDIRDLQHAHNQTNLQKFVWTGSRYVTEGQQQAERLKETATKDQARVSVQPSRQKLNIQYLPTHAPMERGNFEAAFAKLGLHIGQSQAAVKSTLRHDGFKVPWECVGEWSDDGSEWLSNCFAHRGSDEAVVGFSVRRRVRHVNPDTQVSTVVTQNTDKLRFIKYTDGVSGQWGWVDK